METTCVTVIVVNAQIILKIGVARRLRSTAWNLSIHRRKMSILSIFFAGRSGQYWPAAVIFRGFRHLGVARRNPAGDVIYGGHDGGDSRPRYVRRMYCGNGGRQVLLVGPERPTKIYFPSEVQIVNLKRKRSKSF